MANNTSALLCTFFSLGTSLFAQTPSPASAETIEKSRVQHAVEKQLPLLKEAVKPVLSPAAAAREAKLNTLCKRAAMVQKRKQKFFEDLLSGKIQPWQQMRDKYPALEKLLVQIQQDVESINSEKDSGKRAVMLATLQQALLVVGPYLQDADYAEADLSMTKAQHAEVQAFEKERLTKAADKPNSKLISLSPTTAYTLLNLEVPLQVKSAPNAWLYFEAKGGGQFSNGLAVQKIQANEQGMVSTNWISRGDSVADGVIEVSCPTARNLLYYQVTVSKLKLKKLPILPELKTAAQQAEAKLKEAKNKATPKREATKP